MGRWHRVEVCWTDRVPSEREERALVELLGRFDDQADVQIDGGGLRGDWRSPLVSLPAFLAMLHAYGHACRGRWLRYELGDEEAEIVERLAAAPWLTSAPEQLVEVGQLPLCDWQIRWLRRESRRFGRWLPPLPRDPPPVGPRGPRWLRRQGKTFPPVRGPRRFA